LFSESTRIYYLVHSMGVGGGFEEADRRAATSFGRAARVAGVRRIIYLGGLGSGSALSPHLASRQEVGRLLAASGVPTSEFRASIVLGSGSLSFEMIRALVARLRDRTGRPGVGHSADRALRSRGAPGACLLVRSLSCPPIRLQRHAARHRAPGRTWDGIAMQILIAGCGDVGAALGAGLATGGQEVRCCVVGVGPRCFLARRRRSDGRGIVG
jgi:hypothetical protein